MNDSSINPEKKEGKNRISAGLEYRVELVSPICKYEDIETVQEIVRILRRAGNFENESCGIHIRCRQRKIYSKNPEKLSKHYGKQRGFNLQST